MQKVSCAVMSFIVLLLWYAAIFYYVEHDISCNLDTKVNVGFSDHLIICCAFHSHALCHHLWNLLQTGTEHIERTFWTHLFAAAASRNVMTVVLVAIVFLVAQ